MLPNDPSHPWQDSADDGRDETRSEHSDRNWQEILQELRVTQTGTQIISGFLLTLAFQQRFKELDAYQLVIYLILVALAALSTALGLAPVSLHRSLFHRHEKPEMVAVANRLLEATLAVVAVLTAGVVLFLFDVTVGWAAGIIAGIAALLLLTVLLLVIPYLTSVTRRSNLK